ncbi:hypothetical protein BAZMOX_54647_0 [methanotrophic endosymbiont of Bathymodiolus azoricus (Menez Gwen)]|nr:hypothetical protein BAZMOX_54647_0 [methanotrophic endosymbiont of Bathymodiolus azoricus (Menez Gwen)]
MISMRVSGTKPKWRTTDLRAPTGGAGEWVRAMTMKGQQDTGKHYVIEQSLTSR